MLQRHPFENRHKTALIRGSRCLKAREASAYYPGRIILEDGDNLAAGEAWVRVDRLAHLMPAIVAPDIVVGDHQDMVMGLCSGGRPSVR